MNVLLLFVNRPTALAVRATVESIFPRQATVTIPNSLVDLDAVMGLGTMRLCISDEANSGLAQWVPSLKLIIMDEFFTPHIPECMYVDNLFGLRQALSGIKIEAGRCLES